MFKLGQTIAMSCFLSLTIGSHHVLAQTTVDSFEPDVTLTGESLQGINSESIEDNYYDREVTNLKMTVESQKKSVTGNELLDSFIGQPQTEESPAYTLERINTNTGDTPEFSGGTIPITSF